MMRECKQSRDRLLSGGAAGEHLGSCEECARFAARLEGFRSGLAGRHAGVVPDTGFAARVRGGLPRAEADQLGWAVWRLLPVAVALVLVLAIWSYRTPLPLELSSDADEDLLAWVIGDETELPLTRGGSIAAVVAVFLLGLLAGVFSAHLYYANSMEMRGRRGGPPRQGDFVQRLQTELELDEEQARQVGEILRRSHREAETLRRELEPRVREHARATHDRIAAILDEDQRRRFEQMMRGMERRAERFLLGPPGGRPRRHRMGGAERGDPQPAEPQPE